LGNGKWRRGTFPRARHSVTGKPRPEGIFERDAAPRGLPLNWYNQSWLKAHPARMTSLQPSEAVPLGLPKNLLQCVSTIDHNVSSSLTHIYREAKRFLSVKTRKDVPLPKQN
jgi:hypothetical protein